MITFDLNWLAVGVSMIANMFIGGLWYGPLFGKRWMKELGFTMEDIEGGQTWQPYVIAIINSFLMAFVLANAIAWVGITAVDEGLLLGLILWLGFTGFSFGVNHAFEGRSIQLWAINSGMYLAGLLVMGVILTLWT
ncbi:MAG: DUF1761 domain-containing protein [Chloroflexi bacterium]|jgi:hypothetical protein|nr:DUF1761 domain-containing protein [Chloroflexota bacterium]